MKKHKLYKPLLITLITAVIFMQWSATHIHLAGEHDHGGTQHQHTATAHQHQLADHHTDSIDQGSEILSHNEHGKIVNVKIDCAQCKVSSVSQHVTIPSTGWDIANKHIARVHHTPNYITISNNPFLVYSSIQPRAPPYYS